LIGSEKIVFPFRGILGKQLIADISIIAHQNVRFDAPSSSTFYLSPEIQTLVDCNGVPHHQFAFLITQQSNAKKHIQERA
jgi:hypothetical protein